jgi:hypothetical protein
MKALEDYIAAEQRLGRIDKRVDAKLAANVLLASSFFHAFSEQFLGKPMQPSWNKLVKHLIDTVVPATDATT